MYMSTLKNVHLLEFKIFFFFFKVPPIQEMNKSKLDVSLRQLRSNCLRLFPRENETMGGKMGRKYGNGCCRFEGK